MPEVTKRSDQIHDCRHSFASRALALGESLPVIAKLLGHTVDQVKERSAEYDQQDMLDLVDEEVSAARARCS